MPGLIWRVLSGIPYGNFAGRHYAIKLPCFQFSGQPSQMRKLREAKTHLFATNKPDLYRQAIAQVKARWQNIMDVDGVQFKDQLHIRFAV